MYDVRHTTLWIDNQKTSGQVLPRSEYLRSKYFTRGSEGFLARGFEVGWLDSRTRLPSCKIIASGSIKRSGTPKAKPEDPNLSNGAPLG